MTNRPTDTMPGPLETASGATRQDDQKAGSGMAASQPTNERAAFEAWAESEKLAYRDQYGFWFYEAGAGNLYWRGWQARAALAVNQQEAPAQQEPGEQATEWPDGAKPPSQPPEGDAQQADAWRDAVLDELAICCMDARQDESPRSILKRVIAANVQIALDPAVSSEAKALIERGSAQQADVLDAARTKKLIALLERIVNDGERQLNDDKHQLYVEVSKADIKAGRKLLAAMRKETP